MPVYLTEAEVGALLTPADALEAVEGSIRHALHAAERYGEDVPWPSQYLAAKPRRRKGVD